MNGLLALTSAKHSPGVTTTAIAFAVAAGPEPPSLVVEVDPAGGDLAARCGLSIEPGLTSMAAAGRHGGSLDVAAHLQPLPAGPFGLLAPTSPSLTAGALSVLSDRLPEALDAWAGTVILDCGRWQADGPVASLVGAADALLIVLRPTVEGVEHVLARLDEFAAAGAASIGAVLVGDRPYPPVEVAAALGVPVVGTLPYDPRSARALERRTIGAETRRSTVVRAARSALDAMSRWPVATAAVWS